MAGGVSIDLHVKALDESVVRRAKRAGLDAIVYAPHFRRLPEIRERAAAHSDDDLLVLPGREVFTGSWRDRKHVLAIDLDDPVPDFITLSGAMAEFDRQDAVVLAPHPAFATVSLSAGDVRRYRRLLHAVETYNPKLLAGQNRRAEAIAEATSLPAFASSYAHLGRTVGAAWTAIPDTSHETSAILGALRRREPRRVERRSGARPPLQRTLERAHLVYENTWQKFDRVLLRGREATHPRHPAYGGRFDDVAVY